MTVEWDCLVKPLIYVWELVLSAVVVFGTADKLLYTSSGFSGTRCVLEDSLAACSSIIVIGGILLLSTFALLWLRLAAAFGDETFLKVDESVICGLLALGWLVVASVITGKFKIHDGSLEQDLGSIRNVVTAFAWLNFASFLVSAVLAAYKPDTEDGELGYAYDTKPWGQADEFSSTKHGVDIKDSFPVRDDQAVGPDDLVPSTAHDEHLESLQLRKAQLPSSPFYIEGKGIAAGSSTSARDAEIASWSQTRKRNVGRTPEDSDSVPLKEPE